MSMTLAIAHREGSGSSDTAVLDCVRECRPPFSPDAVVKDLSCAAAWRRAGACTNAHAHLAGLAAAVPASGTRPHLRLFRSHRQCSRHRTSGRV